MKVFILNVLLLFALQCSYGQNKYADSLKKVLKHARQDTGRVQLLRKLGSSYSYTYPDTALKYDEESLQLAKRLDFEPGQVRVLNVMGEAYGVKGNYLKALETELEGLRVAENFGDKDLVFQTQFYVGASYNWYENYQKSLNYLCNVYAHRAEIKGYNTFGEYLDGLIGMDFFKLNKLDSAQYYMQECYKLDVKYKVRWYIPYSFIGDLLVKKGQYSQALHYYRIGLKFSGSTSGAIDSYNRFALLYQKTGQTDSAIYYAKRVVQQGKSVSIIGDVIEASKTLTEIYTDKQEIDSAFKYQGMMLKLKDSLFSREKIIGFQNISFKETQRLQDLAVAKLEYKSLIRMYFMIAVVALFLIIGIMLWRNNRHKQKANLAIQKSLAELKTTQKQLIQSEKMASLGELTAGIAHEIQNPLNFVNNFSDVSIELLAEMEDELNNGDKKDALAIAGEIRQNLEKINHHGKRADFIVKGMLQHSRAGTGERQATNVNTLAKEFLKLSYHGLRAKDKSFNAELVTRFDPDLPTISVVQQDIGRVMLNLFNNAFYAVNQKSKIAGTDYHPEVSVSTFVNDGNVLIAVKDNGIGIADAIKEKIMQPFFTTKPTGEGTGLGLSLSYDIVVKGHGGTVTVDSVERDYTEFMVSLPIN